MESARDKRTGEIVDAEQLWIIDPVDPLGYECRGCGALATPCSYRPENKVRPYFSAKDGHNAGCDVEGEVELVKRARKQRVSTREGFPGSFPNRLVLRDTRPMVGPSGTPATPTNNGGHRTNSNGSTETQQDRRWAAQTIRPLCRTFINYPFDRNLSLTVPSITADTYQRVFRSLKSDQIIQYPEPRLFYAPISWKVSSANDNHLEIQLSYGEWEERKLIRPYRVKVNWQNWSVAKRNYVSREIETARLEYMAAKKREDKEKGWLFFIGRQDESDPALFHVDDHRLICCLVAEMIYPSWPTKR
ncbi:Uncharacterised protein [Burkholderia pseudomallei]|nr:Uncharacterised protein [Burkholderia pseudomallei]CAJ7564283.1 Uncharacterised protein [Burkholderia pseudomallei]CAK0347019.1 Uncharacterised protein [Burkholderia pseudomallei]VCH22757.1 Uncharacterised protein [Burkholderia pseudomallei]VCH61583.1 Uncharacterised protein [Burkholderia pseudomallei]